MAYCSHLPNMVGASWLRRIRRWIGARQKLRNILNKQQFFLWTYSITLNLAIFYQISYIC